MAGALGIEEGRHGERGLELFAGVPRELFASSPNLSPSSIVDDYS
jgi:hypothetical protein